MLYIMHWTSFRDKLPKERRFWFAWRESKRERGREREKGREGREREREREDHDYMYIECLSTGHSYPITFRIEN